MDRPNTDQKTHRWDSRVRDYELDYQNIVNNATYLNYLEEARNIFARQVGIDFVEFHNAGYDFVVSAIEIQYRAPLRAHTDFFITTKIESVDTKRLHFEQEIRLSLDNKLIAKALIHVACVNNETWRACMPEMLLSKLNKL